MRVLQIADRMSKGIREAPTKALMGELAVKSGDRPEQAFGGCAGLASLETIACHPGCVPSVCTIHMPGSNMAHIMCEPAVRQPRLHHLHLPFRARVLTHRSLWPSLHLRDAGLRQSAQTFGAIVGASIAAATFRFSGSNYIATFALSAIPAVVALLVVTLVSRKTCLSDVSAAEL